MTDMTPKDLLRDVSIGFIRARAVYAAAKLNVADHIGEGAENISQLAVATGANEEALYRLLRYLSGNGIFIEEAERRFSHSPASEFLRSDHELSDRGMVLLRGEEIYAGFDEIMHSVTTLETGFGKRFGSSIFEYLKSNEPAFKGFQAGMRSMTLVDVQAILKAYDFSNVKKIVDVGGGNGTNLSAILTKHPTISGVLFDLKDSIEMARNGDGGPLPNCEFVVGDFFKEVVSGGDLYIVKLVLHDWYDKEAIQILKNCRKAMSAESKLIIVERLIGPPNQPSFALDQDVVMMVAIGGMERREEDYERILLEAGLSLHRRIETEAEVVILECKPD